MKRFLLIPLLLITHLLFSQKIQTYRINMSIVEEWKERVGEWVEVKTSDKPFNAYLDTEKSVLWFDNRAQTRLRLFEPVFTMEYFPAAKVYATYYEGYDHDNKTVVVHHVLSSKVRMWMVEYPKYVRFIFSYETVNRY